MAVNNNDLKLVLRFDAENKEFIGKVRSAEHSMERLGTKTAQTGTTLKTLEQNSQVASFGLGSLKGQLLGLAAGFSAVTIAVDAKNRLGEYQDIRTRITQLVGSQEQWIQTETYLNQVAEEHNKTVGVLSDTYARLLSLENGGLITHSQTIALFEGMSNAASANGASNEQLGMVMYGLQQALASGTVHAEEFNQVMEPMPDLMIHVAKAANTNVGGLRSLVNAGKMTSQMFSELLVNALASYDGAAARTVDNIKAQEAAFDRAYQKMVVAYEKPISSVFHQSVTTTTDAMTVLADNANTLTTLLGVTLFAAAGRGAAGIANLTRAKVADAVASRAKLVAEQANLRSQLAASTIEVRYLQTMQATNIQKFRATGATNLLTAAETRQAAVKTA